VERRPTREEERERERERRPERDRERERGEGSRREREPANRAVASRTDSPHRGEDASGRKRGRDPREEEVSFGPVYVLHHLNFHFKPSDRTSKRPTRERDRDKEKDKEKEKDRDRRERSGRERDKEHRHRERRRDRDDPNSANASPKDVEIKDRDGSKSIPASLPPGPRSMNDDRRMLVNATEAARRDRERADTPPLGRSLGSNGPPQVPPRSSGSRREARDDRSFEDSPSAIGGSLAARLAESAASLPPRPTVDQPRESERLDREGGRKRSIPGKLIAYYISNLISSYFSRTLSG
jgi:THO complex subunit 2